MMHIGAIYDTNGEGKFVLISGKNHYGHFDSGSYGSRKWNANAGHGGIAAKGKWNHVTGRKYVCDDGTTDGCCL